MVLCSKWAKKKGKLFLERFFTRTLLSSSGKPNEDQTQGLKYHNKMTDIMWCSQHLLQEQIVTGFIVVLHK